MKKTTKKTLKISMGILATILVIGGGVKYGVSLIELVYITYLNSIERTEFRIEGETVYMNREINSKTYDQFLKLHKNNPQLTTIYEENVPGSVDDDTMIQLSYYIREQGLNTKLGCNSKISSGGVDLFIAGVKRIIDCDDPNVIPYIGVHSWSDGHKDAKDFPKNSPEHEQNRKYIEDMLGNDEFYWFTIYAAPAAGIHQMTREEIQKYKLITDGKLSSKSQSIQDSAEGDISTKTSTPVVTDIQ